jgi:hypothetical protein
VLSQERQGNRSDAVGSLLAERNPRPSGRGGCQEENRRTQGNKGKNVSNEKIREKKNKTKETIIKKKIKKA